MKVFFLFIQFMKHQSKLLKETKNCFFCALEGLAMMSMPLKTMETD